MYKTAIFDIIHFDIEDVITTSSVDPVTPHLEPTGTTTPNGHIS